MTSREIRNKFLEFFQNKDHQIVPSAPIVVKDDPTLMFINAGMNQFKDYFLGNKKSANPRVADTQKCLRVSGKHNDLEEVGVDTYHHTMFEMLGNWSFGDYFKEEAIKWAWELLVDELRLPTDRLYVTIFEGAKEEGLDPDNEAFEYWKKIVPEDRILYFGKKDNFWEMGNTGPCGPCSEIHIDLRSEEEINKIKGHELVNKDHPQVIEIWNLVFIQFNRKADQSLESLPEKHIDTGMGLERLVRAIQNKTSNYDTDLFQPLIKKLEEISGFQYGKVEVDDIAFRVIVDHVRAIAFSITDGQLPSNTGAGYVIRRILRRGVRYGYNFLGLKEPFIYKLIPILVEEFKEVFPEIDQQQDFVAKVIMEEEASFLRTLGNGLKKIETVVSELKKDGKSEIDGTIAFELYDTYGFPSDLTELIARENGMTIDQAGFESEMKQQKERSKADAQKEAGDWTVVNEGDETEFIGYDFLEYDSKILRYRTVKEKGKDIYHIVLDRTPFYAESGGQVGDRGELASESERVFVTDTVKENDLIVHVVTKIPDNPEDSFKAIVNGKKRKLTMSNHSATHLLHEALRRVLGNHVEQKGSLVNEKILRFDFSHFAKMTDEEIEQVEQMVNEKIIENIQKQEERNIPIEEAKEKGATALFGEKYGDFVRIITFDPEYSVELCGGTHVNSTGEIGLFKIISEGSVAAGVRRIEAITSEASVAYTRDQEKLLTEIKQLLNDPKDIKQSLGQLVKEKKDLEKKLEKLEIEEANQLKDQLLNKVKTQDGVSTIIEKVSISNGDQLKNIAFQLRNQIDNLFMVIGADINGKPQISVMISDNLVKEKDLNAGTIVRELGKEIQGGGGGQAFFATAGGKNVAGIDSALEKARGII